MASVSSVQCPCSGLGKKTSRIAIGSSLERPARERTEDRDMANDEMTLNGSTSFVEGWEFP